jgi:hypothetical protein
MATKQRTPGSEDLVRTARAQYGPGTDKQHGEGTTEADDDGAPWASCGQDGDDVDTTPSPSDRRQAPRRSDGASHRAHAAAMRDLAEKVDKLRGDVQAVTQCTEKVKATLKAIALAQAGGKASRSTSSRSCCGTLARCCCVATGILVIVVVLISATVAFSGRRGAASEFADV